MSKFVKLSLLGLLVFLIYRAVAGGYEPSSTPAPDETVTNITEPQNDPPDIRTNKVQVNTVVRRFVKAYYLRDQSLFGGGVAGADSRYRRALESLVTESFMNDYVTTLDMPQNEAFVDGSLEQRGRVEKMSYLGHTEDSEADRAATVVVTSYEEGKPLDARTMDIEFLLEKVDDTWRVSGCTCDT